MTSAKPVPPSLATTPSFSRAIARSVGVTDTRLRRNRRFSRVLHGWYCVDRPPGLVQRCLALAEALPPDAVFSDSTAAQLWSLPLPAYLCEPHLPAHIAMPPRPTIPQRQELVVHQRLRIEVATTPEGLRVTSPAQTFCDLAMSLPREALAVVGDAALRAVLTDIAALTETLDAAHHRRGVRLARDVLPLLNGCAQSPPETVLRIRLGDAGLPVEPQCPVVDGGGRLLGHADLGLRHQRVAVEYEGRHHADGPQFDHDIDRYSAFAAAGWLVIRGGPRDLADGCERLVGRVRAAIAAR